MLCGVAVLAVAAILPLLANDSSARVADDIPAEMIRQAPLIKAADRIRVEVERHGYLDYAGIVLEENGVALWWKGPLPTAMSIAVAEARTTARVRVAPARYSRAELDTAAEAIRAVIGSDPDSMLNDVKLRADGSGLVLSVSDRDRPTAMTDLLRRLPHVGVAITTVREPKPQPMSRLNDFPPWHGGAWILTTDGFKVGACTSGFGVRNSTSRYILTAGHCGEIGETFRDWRGEYIGRMVRKRVGNDIALISVPSVSNEIEIGSLTSGQRGRVIGWGKVYPGQWVCQSGARTAEMDGHALCGYQVAFEGGLHWNAYYTGSGPPVRSGDSGGPVFSWRLEGGLIALGIVTHQAEQFLVFQEFETANRLFGVWTV